MENRDALTVACIVVGCDAAAALYMDSSPGTYSGAPPHPSRSWPVCPLHAERYDELVEGEGAVRHPKKNGP